MDQKLRTERRKLADLKAAEYNPRKALTPDDAEYQKIRRSIEEFGYVDPIIINEDGTIIGGHQRQPFSKTSDTRKWTWSWWLWTSRERRL
jgi:hypothetical protein